MYWGVYSGVCCALDNGVCWRLSCTAAARRYGAVVSSQTGRTDERLPETTWPRRVLVGETLLVLGAGLGASAVYALLNIVNRLTVGVALGEQSSSLNNAVTPDRPWLDLAYQLAGIALPVIPALLAVHLLMRDDSRARFLVGWDLRRPWHDLAAGAALAAIIGVPGLGLYLLARELGVNTTVSAAGLAPVWWAIPVLVLASLGNAVLEEVTMLAYLFTRWGQAGYGVVGIVVASALLRGSYHLYQGFGGFVGNIAMGLLLGAVYARTRRVMPMVVAHTLIDVVAFVGYTLLAPNVDWL